ncbi:hypothetical protein ABKA04_004846 [Annulohypoxylon sp. FPYF3050]
MSTDQPPNPSAGYYSHEETVAAITSYYELVQRAHAIARKRDLVYPPPEGWPQLNDPDVAAGYGYNEDCLKLMRHIPYFEYSEGMQILPDVEPCNYIDKLRHRIAKETGEYIRRGGDMADSKDSEDSEDSEERYIPPFLMVLGLIPHEREYGSSCWVDTKLGEILVGNYHGEDFVNIGEEPDCMDVDPDDHSYDNVFYEYDQEGQSLAWRISTFFAACERQLKELEWIPGMSEGEDGRIIQDETSSFSMLSMERRKQIMRDNGWPGDNWNPEAARAEVERSLQQICSERSDRSSGPTEETEETQETQETQAAQETEERASSRCSLM